MRTLFAMHIMLTGASGFLGSVLLKHLRENSQVRITALRSGARDAVRLTLVPEITAPPPFELELLEQSFRSDPPTHIIHAAAMSSPERCETKPDDAQLSNVALTHTLARYAHLVDAHLTTISTDLVFDGMVAPQQRLTEDILPCPMSVYGKTKYEAERATLELGRSAVVRTCLLYGHSLTNSSGVLGWMETAFKSGTPLNLFHDEYRTPIHVIDAARAIAAVSYQELSGIWHCGGPERLSRVEFGQKVADALGYDQSLIHPTSRLHYPHPPPRPADVSLQSVKLYSIVQVPPLTVDVALRRYFYLS